MKTRIMAVALVVGLLSPSWVGAFEHCEADLNGDGEVGPADLAMLLASWGPCPDGCGDGVVEEPEECDPPNGVNCDDDCQIIVPPNCCLPHDFSGCEEPICESLVCDLDPFCCEALWDEPCAVAAAELCPECFWHDCCFGMVGGCSHPACEALICDAVPSCCEVGWTDFCALLAALFCDQCFP